MIEEIKENERYEKMLDKAISLLCDYEELLTQSQASREEYRSLLAGKRIDAKPVSWSDLMK
jgi:dsDNA-binding SOS-regulon protein